MNIPNRKLSDESRALLALDPFMKKCCIADEYCEGGINWHHHLKYGGKAVGGDEWWALLPLCVFHHSQADNRSTSRTLTRIMVARAGKAINKYSKINNYESM